jgi:hypothetical protein
MSLVVVFHSVSLSQWQAVFSDNFNRPDGPLVSPWSLMEDTLFIVSQQVYARTGRYGLMMYNSQFDSAQSVQLSADFNFASDSDGRFQFFIFGSLVQNGGSGYIAKISQTNVSLWTVAPESLLHTSSYYFSTNQTYTAILTNDASTDSVLILIKNSQGVSVLSMGKSSPRRYFYTIAAVGIENSTSAAKFLENVVFEREGATGVAQDASLNIPSHFVLGQNYPNPFNPSTTISFSLPSNSFVSLKILDVLGREVSNLVSEELSAGAYSRRWNAEGLASGMYFYRLQAGSYIETKKLVLLR